MISVWIIGWTIPTALVILSFGQPAIRPRETYSGEAPGKVVPDVGGQTPMARIRKGSETTVASGPI